MARRVALYSVVIACSLVGLYCLRASSYRRSMEHRIAPIVCRNNLKLIAEAKAQWAQEHQKTTNDSPVWADLLKVNGYIQGREPKCRSGGVYALEKAGVPPRCSIPDHNPP
jgi:hypothetical protein